MSNLVPRIRQVLALGALLSTTAVPNELRAQDSYFPLSDLKAEVHRAISDASKLANEEPYFLVRRVKFELKGTTDQNIGGGFGIPIFKSLLSASAEQTHKNHEELKLEIVPSDTVVVGGANELDLASAVQSIREAFKEESKGKRRFNIPDIQYTMTWSLSESLEGKVDFVVASAKTGIDFSKQQKITFVLCETANLRECINE